MTARSSDANPSRSGLDALLDLNDPVADWSDADLGAMLQHQLAQPMDGSNHSIRTALLGEDAHVELLEMIKRNAKIRRAQADAAVPQDLWRVIYYAAIAAALRRGHRVSELSAVDLAQGFSWTLARPWIDAPLRAVVQEAAARLDDLPR